MNENTFPNPEIEMRNKFSALRKQIHEKIEEETEKRIKENPNPTEEEIYAGAFREMIEPQIRDALFECYRKGYSSESSGFGGEYGEIQSLDGYFDIDEETEEKIKSLGASVLKGKDIDMPHESKYYTYIQFKPKSPDINEIKKTWDAIVAVLPTKKDSAKPSISGSSEDFRNKYAPERTDIEKVALENRLALNELSPEAENEIKKRLEELSK